MMADAPPKHMRGGAEEQLQLPSAQAGEQEEQSGVQAHVGARLATGQAAGGAGQS